jgi:hypothetical protein
MKFHRSFPSYLPLFIFFPLIHSTHWSGNWVFQDSKGLYLTLREEGAKVPEGKSSWKKIKGKIMKPLDSFPRDPRERNKMLINKKQRIHKIIKSRPSWRIRGLITSKPIRSMGM